MSAGTVGRSSSTSRSGRSPAGAEPSPPSTTQPIRSSRRKGTSTRVPGAGGAASDAGTAYVNVVWMGSGSATWTVAMVVEAELTAGARLLDDAVRHAPDGARPCGGRSPTL